MKGKAAMANIKVERIVGLQIRISGSRGNVFILETKREE